jgi:hypothetical protein
MSENNESTIPNIKFSFQIGAIDQQIELLTKVNKELKDKMDSIKQHNNGDECKRSNV